MASEEHKLDLQSDLFGEFRGARIRKTDDVPPKISVLDFIEAVTETPNPRRRWADIRRTLEEAGNDLSDVYSLHQFPGARQRDTPVTDARGMVLILNFLPGKRAQIFRESCANVVVRYLGGDETLIGEIRQLREVQQQLPGDHPLRVFGEDVEARAPPEEELDDVRALKRQRIKNELELENAKHANELTRLQ